MNRQLQLIDFFIIGISVLAVISSIFYFANISNPTGEFGTKEYDPFYIYYTNQGIVTIFSIRTFLWVILTSLGFLWIRKKNLSNRLLLIFMISIGTVAMLEWFELWYGSTFYYGEVRDKQGLGLPIFSILLLTYISLKLTLIRTVKVVIILSIISVTYIVYNLIKDSWNLTFEICIPGTSIPIM